MIDYRSTDTDVFPSEQEINSRKSAILNSHTTLNHYEFISNRRNPSNNEFRKAFNFKCAYCGVNEKINPVLLFEVDHYICQSSNKTNFDFNNIDNLINSCYSCNRHKSGFDIDDNYLDILNPKRNIHNVFMRDNNFTIIINSNFNSDEYITKFYKKMKFDHDLRRLDYLIMSIMDLETKINNKNIKDKLNIIKGKLIEKRNIMIV